MTPLELLSDEQFERHAFEVLRRELGVDGLARFLRLYRATNSDYTRDRRQWLGGLTVEEIVADLNQQPH